MVHSAMIALSNMVSTPAGHADSTLDDAQMMRGLLQGAGVENLTGTLLSGVSALVFDHLVSATRSSQVVCRHDRAFFASPGPPHCVPALA